jgi:hypothetical protein
MKHAAQLPSRRLFLERTGLGVMAAVGAACGLTACVTQERVIVREKMVDRPVPPPAQIRPMPAPVREDRGAAPGAGWNWVPGHWRWQGADWFWVHGQWVRQPVPPMPPVIVEQITVAPSPRLFWVPGHWVWHAERGGWIWVNGAWHG